MSDMQHGVILQNDEYIMQPVLGDKNDGEVIMFPPLCVPKEEVLGYFGSEAEAKLFIAAKKLQAAEKALAAEKTAHEATKERVRLLLKTLGTFEGHI